MVQSCSRARTSELLLTALRTAPALICTTTQVCFLRYVGFAVHLWAVSARVTCMFTNMIARRNSAQLRKRVSRHCSAEHWALRRTAGRIAKKAKLKASCTCHFHGVSRTVHGNSTRHMGCGFVMAETLQHMLAEGCLTAHIVEVADPGSTKIAACALRIWALGSPPPSRDQLAIPPGDKDAEAWVRAAAHRCRGFLQHKALTII